MAVWLMPYVTDQVLSKNVSNTITTLGYSRAEDNILAAHCTCMAG